MRSKQNETPKNNCWQTLNNNQGILAIAGILIALLIYFHQNVETEKYVDESIDITSCINRKIAENFITADNKDWRQLERFETKIYFENIPSFFNNYSTTTNYRAAIMSTIHNMDTRNRLLDQVEFELP